MKNGNREHSEASDQIGENLAGLHHEIVKLKEADGDAQMEKTSIQVFGREGKDGEMENYLDMVLMELGGALLKNFSHAFLQL